MKNIITLLVFLFLTHCVTAPPSTELHTDIGVWNGKVQTVNKTTNNKKWANVSWASDSRAGRMRIDVSAVLDIPIATYIKNSEGSHLWLFTEQKYFFSQDSEKLFKFLTKLSLDPSIFYSMLGVPKPPGVRWKCQGESGLYRCTSRAEQTVFTVKHQDRDQRVINVEKGSKSLRIRLSRSKVEVRERMFKPLSTSQFKTIKI